MNKQDVIEKIRALMAKSIDNGATEAEAVAAAAKAKELMDKYQITMSETELREEGCEGTSHKGYKRGFNVKRRLGLNVGLFCECRVWFSKQGGALQFFGIKSDKDFAIWLVLALESFVWAQHDRNRTELEQRGDYYNWAIGRSFVEGCIDRLNKRLKDETRKRKPKQMATGTDLMVVKQQLVQNEFEKLGVKLNRRTFQAKVTDELAYTAGQAAGDKANLNRPMGAATRTAVR